MNVPLRILAVGALLAPLAACAPEAPAAAVDVEAERAAIVAADERYEQAIADRDAETLIGFYATNAKAYPPGAPAATGTAELRTLVEELLSMPDFEANVLSRTATVSSGGDLGYTEDVIELTMTGPDGTPMSETIRDVHVWRKEADGSWKIVIDIWSPEAPPPGPSD